MKGSNLQFLYVTQERYHFTNRGQQSPVYGIRTHVSALLGGVLSPLDEYEQLLLIPGLSCFTELFPRDAQSSEADETRTRKSPDRQSGALTDYATAPKI